jgi:hypothetical protein
VAQDDDELGDAASREAVRRHQAAFDRNRSQNGEYAYAPRWVPHGNWRMSLGDVLVVAFGSAILLLILGMRLFTWLSGA